MEKIKVVITDKQSLKLPAGMRMLLRRACLAVLTYENFNFPAEISLTFVDAEEIRRLNREFRDKDSVTDVLSFPLGENGEYDINPENGMKLLGDIVICADKAAEQAATYGHSLQREMCFLTVHSALHLLGYDHMDEAAGDIMRQKEKEIMSLLGVERNYNGI